MVDLLQCAIVVPANQVAVQGAAGWKVLGNISPLAASTEHIHDAIDEIAVIMPPIEPAMLGRRYQRADQRPFFIRHIAGIAQLAAVVSGTVLVCPHLGICTCQTGAAQRIIEGSVASSAPI